MQGNVPHVARVAQRKCWLIDNYFKEYKHLKIAEPHEQRAVHCVCNENELLLYNNLFFTQGKWGKADVYVQKEQTAPSPDQATLFRACFNLRALCVLCYLDFNWGLPPTDTNY